MPGRKAAGDLRRLRPAGQTGLRVEVILRLPKATLQGYRGKSGGRLDAFHPPFPSPAVLEAQRTPPVGADGRLAELQAEAFHGAVPVPPRLPPPFLVI